MPDNPYSMSNNTSDATAFVPQSSSEGLEKRDQEKGSKKKFSSYQTTESNVVDNLHQDDQPTPEYDSSSLGPGKYLVNAKVYWDDNITDELYPALDGNSFSVVVSPLHEYLPGGWGEYNALLSDHLPVVVRLRF